MPWTVLGGMHQQDGRIECDRSDPYVLHGDAGRTAHAALAVRTIPNIIGIHLHDEPGLTWWVDPVTKSPVQHNIPAQDRAYQFAYGTKSPRYNEVKPDDPASVKAWMERSQWKLSFLESAWRAMDEKVRTIRPDYLTVNQHMYGWYAYGDGYYTNVWPRRACLTGMAATTPAPAIPRPSTWRWGRAELRQARLVHADLRWRPDGECGEE